MLIARKLLIIPAFIVLFLLAGKAPGSAGKIDNIGQGHFSGRALSPALALRPGVAMVQMPDKPPGTWSVGLEGSWGNIWNQEPGSYTIDGEFVRVEPRLAYTLLPGLEIGIFLPVTGRMGGFADGFIENFHKYFNLNNAARDEFPRDRLLIEVTDKDGNRVTLNDDSWGINDLPVFASVLLTEGTALWPAVSSQLTITLPVGDEDKLQGWGTPVYELGTILSKRLGKSRFIVCLGGSISYCSQGDFIGIPLHKTIFSGLLALEYQCMEEFSLLIQYCVSSPAAKDFYEFSEPINEINLGFKWRLTNSLLVELSIMENMFNYQNSTDIGMNVGLTQSW